MIRIEITPEALDDLSAGSRFYQIQESGAGDYFAAGLKAEIESLRFTAGIHRQIRGFHRAVCRIFPHSIYYRFEAETITVIAIIDNRRSPSWIRNRLQK